jgi:hypothetical protein
MADPRALSDRDDEPVGFGEESVIAFDESRVDLDDTESDDMVAAVLVVDELTLVGEDDEAMHPALDPLDDDVARAGSWITDDGEAPLDDERSLTVDREYEALTADLEGLDESAIELGELPPLDRGDDDADGPATLEIPKIVDGPPVFALAAPAQRSFVPIAERDADALVSSRTDTLRTNDGVDRSSERTSERRGDATDGIVAAVREGELLAFGFARGVGKVSRDGGDSFVDVPWMQGATALAARGPALFGAIYDGPVDRCTIVRDDGATVARVVDVHSFALNDEVGCCVLALVVLNDEATRLLVRTASASYVVSLA